MKSLLVLRLLFVTAVLAFGTAALRAQDLNAVKGRMEQRLGSVNALKDRGIAGENNRGFLEVRGAATGADQQVISDENADRRAVYAALAAQTGANADAVGRQRAQQIATIAKRGHWIQESNGEWRQKG
jgi:uncharacterized protein YdbL (DUF1318 family)